MQAGHIDNFKHLSQFRDLKDFNNNVEQWLVDVKAEFTKAEVVALKHLIRFAAKVPGVCNAKIGTLVSATHNDTIGISRSSFERMLRKAKAFGLVEVHNTAKRGYQAHNVYVFNVYVTEKVANEVAEETSKEVPQSTTIDAPIKANNLTESNSIINKRMDALDSSYVGDHVPKRFTDLVKCFFTDAKTIEEYYRIYRISTYYLEMAYDSDVLLNVGLDAFKQTIRKLKGGRVRNTFAYYYGVLQRKLDKLYYELVG
ncbi:hypothetical protein [Priestia taiwanensis]|uniref:Uncharacterized protein n=1 Tax=Priestia taiwanensis TaxID=1347902 RepID=A0A917AWY3_9BACI|nr:hypothetical protein [Priestia taiwanensis]MBM7364567.1 hypothetical protein [Priestia taiwanensis]GGE80512.1 hypothetical protein GCM10007140_32510 [Priestia taiwanensis]